MVSGEEKKAREKMLLLNHTASNPIEGSVRKGSEKRSGLVAAVPTIRRHYQPIQMLQSRASPIQHYHSLTH